MIPFKQLSTVDFQKKMRPHALNIYQMIWPGCIIRDLRDNEKEVHVLDKEFGIDTISYLESGQTVTMQEKYRDNYFLRFGDFTQEYKNADGQEHESFGEWFNLAAQMYFYGWANKKMTRFVKWFLMDVSQYKMIVEAAGGIEKFGPKRFNLTHGGASFYGISVGRLMPAFITDYTEWEHGIYQKRLFKGGKF